MTSAAERTLTFLFTDVEGSTRLWEAQPDAMRVAMARHDELLERVVRSAGGRVVKSMGDGVLAVFESPLQGVSAAVASQRAVEELDGPIALRVRMAVHSGPASERDDDYFGPTLNRAARIMGLGHGGQVLASEAVAVLVRDRMPPELALRDLGEHRLRDLTHVERVYQVESDGLTPAFPPLRSLDAYTTNLPFQPTSFIGRGDDVERLNRLLREQRLVTLTGVGGVGKTRLALRVAAELLPDLRDGAVVCELANAEASDTVDEIVAQAIGIVARPGLSLRESIVESLRGRASLVVLDNCEHVLDAAATLATDVLRNCREMQLLATSREALAVDGEQLYPVRSLAVPTAVSADSAAASDAIALFAERARAITPSFTVDDHNIAAIVEICRRLDGIPLAIELAAARTASMQPTEIAGLLDERFRLLGGGRRRSVERHQTLRTAIDWSYSLLDERSRLLFARLGVFTGSFDSAAAIAVAGDGADHFEVRDTLEELAAKSMLTVDGAGDGTTRYQLLETLRQYAMERLAEFEALDDVRMRHARHFAAVTAEVGPQILGPDEVTARERLHRDLDNVRAAVDWAIDEQHADILSALLAPIAQEAGWTRGSGVGGWCTRALVVAPQTPDPDWDWVQMAAQFHAYTSSGDWDAVARSATSFIDRADCDGEVRAWAYAVRGFTLIADSIEASVAMLRDGADALAAQRGPQALSLVAALAMFAEIAGNHDEAIQRAEESMTRAAALRFPSGSALAHLARGLVRVDHDPTGARADLDAALALADDGAAEIVLDHAVQTLAILHWRDGDVRNAAAWIAKAIERSARVGDYSACVTSLVLATAVIGAARRFEDTVVANTGIRAPELFGMFGYPNRTEEDHAREVAVGTAREQLGDDVADSIGTATKNMTRDEFVRRVVATLEEITASADAAS